MGEFLGALMAEGAQDGALPLGSRTYEEFARYWPEQPDSPYTEALTRSHKYVVSTT
jgi:hypothetical protein